VAPGIMVVGSLTPLIKTPGEALSGKSLYPRALKGLSIDARPIADRWDWLAGQAGLQQEMRKLTGRPLKQGS